MTATEELNDLRYGTALYINDDAKTVELVPNTTTQVAGGGTRNTPGTAREPQQFRFIRQPGTLDSKANSEGGQTSAYTYLLVGYYDAEIEVGDSWNYGDTDYRVVSVERTAHQTVAAIRAFGKEPNYG